ncbi:MAG: O-antigen ligase family protein [Pseudomonadota bacterium]|nr:O-antigen ligase family protein [Pseudomonadota bacterium]
MTLPRGLRTGLQVVAVALLAVLLATFPYIDLGVDLDLHGRHLDTPLADLAGAALLVVVAGLSLGAGGSAAPRNAPGIPSGLRPPGRYSGLRPPGLYGYALLVAVGLVALATVPDRGASAWFLLRKPLFFYVAYGVGLAWVVTHVVSRATLRRLLLATVVATSLVSLTTSVGRIAAGNTLWFAAIEGLTNNHKTLAVALAPLVPLVLALRRGRVDLGVAGLAAVAIALSLSRTAWIATGAGLTFFAVWKGYTLASRRGVLVGVVVVGVLAALYGPLLMRSNAQLDAARSRHSLDKRAWTMVGEHPALGMGGGANVRVEMQTFPHYRVNGVDAHGVVQKVASEYGVVGLLGYLGFVGAMALRLRRRAPVDARYDAHRIAPAHLGLGLWATFVALHVNLLLSTETFSQTHWIPLGVVWGLSWRRGST